MIGTIGPAGILRDNASLDAATPTGTSASASPSTAALLAGEHAPVDGAKVAALRAAIADGSYRIDPRALAEKMIALDLPRHDQ